MTLPNATIEQLVSAHDFYLIYVRPGPGGYSVGVSIAEILQKGPPLHSDGTPLTLARMRLYSDEELAFGTPAVEIEYGVTTYEEEFESYQATQDLSEAQFEELREEYQQMVAQNTLYDVVEAREEGIRDMIDAGDFSFLPDPEEEDRGF